VDKEWGREKKRKILLFGGAKITVIFEFPIIEFK